MLASLQLRHRHEIVREQSIRLDQGARRSFERGVAEPMTEAQKMLLENRFLGNVGVFRETRFQRFGIGFVRRRDVTHFADPFDRNERGRSMALNSLTSYLWQIYMSSNVKAGAKKLYLRLKIFLWLGGLAYFALLGAGGLHAGEAKSSWAVEWERTVEAPKMERKVVVSIPASAARRTGIEPD